MPHPSEPSPVDQILAAERARRPRWLVRARESAPGWFRGRELDLLDAPERARLYAETRTAFDRVASGSLLTMAALMLPNAIDRLHAGEAPALWVGVIAGYAVLALAAVLLRRRNMRDAACRTLRERPDWPLRVA